MFTQPDVAIEFLLSPTALLMAAIGSLLGIFVGAIPGLTGAMLIALTLPLTYSMPSELALVLLVAMYVGSVSGGLVTATLLRIPGTPASMMTTLDGYPMARRGQSGRALALGIGGSFLGGMISWGFLVCLAQPMAVWSLTFGPFEFFALVVVAMILIASVGGKSLSLGLFSGALGVMIAMPGASPATGMTRWTFGIHELDDGFKLLPVLIGLFAVNQVIRQILDGGDAGQVAETTEGDKLDFRIRDLATHGVNLLRSALIGTWIGILPGIGANVGSVIAYSAARRASKTPERFGSGSEEGIVASETANNATVGGALIPLVAMGIPGSVIDAILLGALVIHGLQPGPMLVQSDPLAVQTIVGTMLIANVLTLLFLLASVRVMVRAARVPSYVLVPVVMVFCVIGSYALANRMFDVWVMLAFGVVGYLMERFRIPIAPLVIGLVLAPIGEEHLAAGLMKSGGSLMPMFTQPISLGLCLLALAMVAWTLWRRFATRPDSADLT
ncbi:Tripartite tricarboxylate transporter TctA family protein [Stieleria maiorica]|uniref:Tripartite tricarboxylate transporter TctA family protein n=1 Tax=Stieleria maiorica TaxID=2795974 RepID=A0A5B9MKL2_9BACT|nr:tripartite tricarboxylate transporter permease [Stieleria maiorica]QEG00561.1 Tripartite tricarboxylate transporter TctA family protein [Stieleria maiorica]